ncbi:hypothetical protein PV327_000488 [Microctonus hyperodae]|uniref:Uncharacterized protein n=1 Tax=Microctonus hyperodae TaxID=165561 RepID=A0AA39G6B7_MICHY|nr:hypothetical protein PV327_000488 [Microctonus hyperodae]
MRTFVIAAVIISIVLLIADDTNAKKSHSNRKKRSNVANPSISDKKYNNDDAVKYHDKSKQKKRSIDTMDEEIPDSEGQNRKHTKLRHHKKYNDLEVEQNDDGRIKIENKHKCEKHGKCKKIPTPENSPHKVDDIYNDDDRSSTSSTSKSSMKHENKHGKEKKNQDTETGENTNDDYDTAKQNKHSKNYKNMKKSKHGDKKKCETKHETINDGSSEINSREHKKKCLKSKKSTDNSNSKIIKNIKPNRDEEQKEDKSVPEEVELKNRNIRSSNNIDPAEEEVDENVHGNIPEMCVKEVTNDNQDSVDKTCEI